LGRVKILDFGLAQSSQAEATGEIVGTPAYMSPEQCKGAPVDARSDLFSLGCVLYRMATGQHPFRRGADTLATLWQVALEVPPSPRTLNPKIPKKLSKLIDELLAKPAHDRPESAQAVESRLTKIERALKPRWPLLLGLAVATTVVKMALIAWWYAPPAPVPVTFAYDEPNRLIVVQREDEEPQRLDLADQNPWSLAPGLYQVRAGAAPEGRQIEPATFMVAPKTPLKQTLRLVGEIRREFHTLPVTGVARLEREPGQRLVP
jgi:serine/threonine protein kinase